MARKVIVLAATLAIMVGLFALATTFAQDGGPSASRTISPSSVAPGGEVTVTITLSGVGSFADIAETLPAGFTYVSSSDADQVERDGQTVTLSLLGKTEVTYTVTAPAQPVTASFSGTLSGVDAGNDPFSGTAIGGDTSIEVAGAAQDGGPSASRTISPSSVAPGGEVTVTITLSGVGSFADIAETLPAGFTFVSSSDADQVERDGQTVTLSLLGKTEVTYTVTAPAQPVTASFSGTLSGVDAGNDPFSGTAIGGDTSIEVAGAAQDGGPSASRTISPSSVAPGGEVTVTITLSGVGSFADIAETLPAGFTFVSSSDADQVERDGQTVTLSLLGKTEVTYTVTAPAQPVTASFSGTFSGVDADNDPFSGTAIGGDTSIEVAGAAQDGGPSASRTISPSSVAPGGEVTVTITLSGVGSFADIAETLPAGFTYVSSSNADQVERDGQTVTLSLLGKTEVTYTVTAPAQPVTASFSGTFSGVDADNDPFSGTAIGGASSVRVRTPSTGGGGGGGTGGGGDTVGGGDTGGGGTPATTTPTDDPPRIAGGTREEFNVPENMTAVASLSVVDGRTVTWSISGGFDAAEFTIGAESGALTFKAAPDFENPDG